jgi:hypothetical protein
MRKDVTESLRQCGACNRCCKTLFIADVETLWFKPQGVWCEHARRGKGCTIHGAHPTACQEYECFWLASQHGRGGERAVLPGALRPDRCGAVLEENHAGEMVVWMDAERSDPINRSALAKFVDREVDAGRVVVARVVHARTAKVIGHDEAVRAFDERCRKYSDNLPSTRIVRPRRAEA